MAKKLPLYDCVVEDDYIDMDISSATFLCCSKPSPRHSREFEFQMSFGAPERETTPSPADELFYKGKLLPLHIPPRLQMLQKLLQSSTNSHGKDTDAGMSEENLAAASATAARSGPSESCNVSRELSTGENMYEFSQSKKSWYRKLKSIKQSSIGLKLKASKAYLSSLFANKSGCPEELDAASKAGKDRSSGHPKAEKKSSFYQLIPDTSSVTTLMRSIERDKLLDEECFYRKSFSGAINCHLTPRSSPAISSSSSSSTSSSFSSTNSNRFSGPRTLNRSSSASSETESPIQGAIAHCKRSQVTARKSVSEAEFCSLSASRIVTARDNQEKPGHCRG